MAVRIDIIIAVIIAVILIVWLHELIVSSTNGSDDSGRPVHEGNGECYYKSRGNDDDSVEMLLNRIDWNTDFHKCYEFWPRVLLPTIISVILISLMIYRKLPPISHLILMVIIIFIVFYATFQYMYTHGDIYRDSYVRDNVNRIRDKLNLPAGEPSDPQDNFTNDKLLQ